MGNAVSSTLTPVVATAVSAIDTYQRVEDPYMKKVRDAGCASVTVDQGDDYIIRRSKSAGSRTREEIDKEYTRQQTMPLLLKGTCEKFASRTAVAWRKIVKEAKETITDEKGQEKEWGFLYLSDRESMTFAQLWGKIIAMANGLKSIGVKPGDKIALYEETRYEWLVSCYAAWIAGANVVTVYANLGDDALIYALRESEVKTIVCASKAVKKLIGLCEKSNIKLANVIATDHEGNAPTPAGQKPVVHDWNNIVDAGNGQPEPSTLPTKTTDDALIMYTSGTTGDPKGVVLNQGNVLAAVNGLDYRLQSALELAGEDPSYVAYLPLAHILEFAAENLILKNGFMLGYGNPRTLTNTSARPHGDLQEFKPALLAGVPRVFDTIKKAVEAKLPPVGTLKRTLFDRAFEERKDALNRGLNTPFYTSKIFGAAASALGGNVKLIVSGGAPLSAKTQEWMGIVLGTKICQGYGLTETGANGTVGEFGYYNEFENAGKLLHNTEIKLRTVGEFKVTAQPPRGEILIRTAAVAQGYYKQPEKTAEAFLDDGFFATGDVGEFRPDGTLKIVGRTKAIAKTAHGEYVAMEALESMYVQNDLVLPNGICVHVDSLQPFIVGVALTDETKAMKFAKENNLEGAYPAILQDPKFRKAALASLAKTAKDNGKKPFEMFKNIRFYSDEWTPENGILTAAMKLKRREIDAKYGKDIAEMYKESS